MNIYNKFSKYLIENYAMLWHSKFLPMISIGIVLNMLFYAAGYGMMTFDHAMENSLRNYFEDTSAYIIYGILVFVIATIWMLTYFKNIAIKKFYPLSASYMLKLFCLNIIAIFILSLCKMSYTTGGAHKGRTFVSAAKLVEDMDQMKLAEPFFGLNSGDYAFSQRRYPEIYQDMKLMNYDELETGLKVKQGDSFIDYKINPKDTRTFRVNGNNYFFYFSHEVKEDSCNEIEVLDSLVDYRKLSDFKIDHIVNFSGSNSDRDYEYDDNEVRNSYIDSFTRMKYRYLGKVHNLVKSNNSKVIIGVLNDAKKIMNSYHVSSFYSSDSLYHLWNRNQFSAKQTPYIFSFNPKSTEYDASDQAVAVVDEAAAVVSNASTTEVVASTTLDEESTEEEEKIYFEKQKYYVNFDLIHNHIRKLQEMHQYEVNISDFMGYIYLAFFLTMIILLFEFGQPVKILISVPIFGILSLVMTLAWYFIFKEDGHFDHPELPSPNDEAIRYLLALLLAVFIYGMAFYGLYGRRLSKRITSIFFYIAFAFSPVALNLFFLFIRQASREAHKQCGDWVYSYSFEYENPYLILIVGFIGFLVMSFYVKKYIAKED